MAVPWIWYSLIPSFCEQNLKREVGPLLPKTFCRNSAGESSQCLVTRNTAGKPCLACVLDPLQAGTTAGLLTHLRFPVPHHLSPGAWQQHFLMPKKWEQTIYRHLHPEHLLRHRTRVKTLNNSSTLINSYKPHPLLCSGSIRMSQKSAGCQKLYHRQFSLSLTLCSSEETALIMRQLYSRQIHSHCPGVPGTWQFTIETCTYYGITVSTSNPTSNHMLQGDTHSLQLQAAWAVSGNQVWYF